MAPKSQNGEGGTATTDNQKVEFLTRLLFHNCNNPTVKNFEFNEMPYKTAWAYLDRIKKEVFSNDELTALKNAPKDSSSVGDPEVPKATPKRKAAGDNATPKATPKRSTKKAKTEAVDKTKKEVKDESDHKEDLDVAEDGEVAEG